MVFLACKHVSDPNNRVELAVIIWIPNCILSNMETACLQVYNFAFIKSHLNPRYCKDLKYGLHKKLGEGTLEKRRNFLDHRQALTEGTTL
jgi:hypothetical protein